MKKLVFGLIGATMLLAPLAVSSAASAEPHGEIWKCWNLRIDTYTISKTQYWACPLGTINIIDTGTGRILRKLDGYCANQLWQRTGHQATWVDAVEQCTE